MRSVPHHEAMAAPAAAMATMRQSIWAMVWGRALLMVATRAVMTMTASEVAMAFLCSMPSAAVKAGTITIPPPTPQSAPRSPAAAPTVSAMMAAFMGIWVLWFYVLGFMAWVVEAWVVGLDDESLG